MAKAVSVDDASVADVLKANSEAFFYKLDDMEFKVRKASQAFLQDEENYILCLETPDITLMSVLLANSLRKENISNKYSDLVFTDFHNLIITSEQQLQDDNYTYSNSRDILVCKVDAEEQLEQYSEVLMSWAGLVKHKSKKIILIMKNCKYLEQSMMKTRMVDVLKLKFTKLWEENDTSVNNDVLNNAVTNTVNEEIKIVKANSTNEAEVEITSTLQINDMTSINAEDKQHLGKISLHLIAENGQNKAQSVCDSRRKSKNTLPKHGGNQNARLETSLLEACYKNDVRSVEILLHFGANIEAVNEYGSTSLHLATERGQYEIVSILLTFNANVNATNYDCQTPLHNACCNNDVSVIELLLKFGAEIEAEDKYGRTPLHLASGFNNTVVTTLLKLGSNINAQDNDGCTPLFIAIQRNKQDVVVNLLKNGADINIKNNKQQSAIDYARSLGKTSLIPIIEEHAKN